jgi:hypothetical protein
MRIQVIPGTLLTSFDHEPGFVLHNLTLLVPFFDEDPFVIEWYCVQRFFNQFPGALFLVLIKLRLYCMFLLWPFGQFLHLIKAVQLITDFSHEDFNY